MRVLVTGGAGFVGSHVVARLAARGDDVVVLDDLSAGSEAAVDHPRVDLVVGDVTDRGLVARLAARVDRIVHLASIVGVERVTAHPEHTERVIGLGTRNCVDAAVDCAIPAIVVTSSEVYGFAPPAPVPETFEASDDDAFDPRWSYVRAKRFADRIARAAAARGARVLAVRPFNIVGERQREDGGAVLPRFVARALADLPLEVDGDGKQSRAFLDVRDAAAALVHLLDRERFPFDAVNLGGVDEWTMNDLAHEVVRVLGSRSEIVRVVPSRERRSAEIRRRLPCLARLEQLGVAPTHVDIAAIVRRVATALEATAAHA
jgi:UDP-glucose 4-epimerase